MFINDLSGIRRNANGLTFEMDIPDNYPYLEGHFEKASVLAGVIQLGIVIELIDRGLHLTAQVNDMKVVKFTQLVLPPTRLSIDLVLHAEKHCVQFKILNKGTRCASGKLFLTDEN